MSPSKDSDKMPAFPTFNNLYGSHQPQPSIRDDIKDEADFAAICNSKYPYDFAISKLILCIFNFFEKLNFIALYVLHIN